MNNPGAFGNMGDLKFRAGEKFEAFQVAAKSAVGNGKSRVDDVYQQAIDAIQRLRDAFNEVWSHELVRESRERISAFARDAAQRIREGAPPLHPRVLYEELKALLADRVWRRSVFIFCCGAALGAVVGVSVGVKLSAASPAGPHTRALHSHRDHPVILVDDAVAPGAAADEVLIRVQALSTSPLDRAVLRGHAAALRALLRQGPVTVGRGFAGVVLDVGRDVNALELGDAVWGCVSEWAGGAATELLTIRSTRVSKRPLSLSANDAASLPWAGCLALRTLATLKPHINKAHNRVAICGASSGEGTLLVQMLSREGAHLTVMAPRHTLATLQELGAHEAIELECANSHSHAPSWSSVEQIAAKRGPWDATLVCGHASTPPGTPDNYKGILRSTAHRSAILDLRPRSLVSDRLPGPFSFLFAVSFYTYRVLRWLVGKGTHTDWLEDERFLSKSLAELATIVDEGKLTPVLDKVYLPQDFESALAHACSEDAIGTTVVRFP